VIDLDPALRQEFLDVPVGEAEPQVPPDGKGDDLGWKAVAGEGRARRGSGTKVTARSHRRSVPDATPVANATVPPCEFEEQLGTRIRNGRTIREHALTLADAVEETLSASRSPVVLGGDCSIMLGSLLGARRGGRCGLVHVDGHCDFFHPGNYDTASRLGSAAGMDLALATGRGELLLTRWPTIGLPLVPESTVRNRCRLANLLIDSCIGPYRRRMRGPQLHPRVPPGADPVPGVIVERPGDEPLDGRMEPWPDSRGRSPPIANVKLPPYPQRQPHEVSLVSAEIPSSPSPEPQDVPPRREGVEVLET
jgi:hypothetical protein